MTFLPFFVVGYRVHDMKRLRSKVMTVGVILGVDAAALALFGALGYV
jgi:hypothetical protein